MYLQLENINFRYDNSTNNALNDFNLEIKEGEIVAVLGESGSGKSTLLRIISGFEVSQSGELKIEDRIIFNNNKFTQPEKREIGMVFQDYALFPHLTVFENIKFGLKKLPKKEIKSKVEKILDLVSLSDYSNRYPHELSGGQQQRVALARSIILEPKLLLMDEPFSNLDSHLQNKIRNELRDIIVAKNITTIFVTHDEEDALKIADKVVVLKDGNIISSGKTSEILDSHEDRYINEILIHHHDS